MSYIDSDGSKKKPIMIHRAIFGSLERFFGILVENYAGWLCVCGVGWGHVVATQHNVLMHYM